MLLMYAGMKHEIERRVADDLIRERYIPVACVMDVRDRGRRHPRSASAVVEADRGVRPVAERLVAGVPAPTQRLPVAHLVREAIGRDHRDAASHGVGPRRAL